MVLNQRTRNSLNLGGWLAFLDLSLAQLNPSFTILVYTLYTFYVYVCVCMFSLYCCCDIYTLIVLKSLINHLNFQLYLFSFLKLYLYEIYIRIKINILYDHFHRMASF
jgi:hypothetical protein